MLWVVAALIDGCLHSLGTGCHKTSKIVCLTGSFLNQLELFPDLLGNFAYFLVIADELDMRPNLFLGARFDIPQESFVELQLEIRSAGVLDLFLELRFFFFLCTKKFHQLGLIHAVEVHFAVHITTTLTFGSWLHW